MLTEIIRPEDHDPCMHMHILYKFYYIAHFNSTLTPSPPHPSSPSMHTLGNYSYNHCCYGNMFEFLMCPCIFFFPSTCDDYFKKKKNNIINMINIFKFRSSSTHFVEKIHIIFKYFIFSCI